MNLVLKDNVLRIMLRICDILSWLLQQYVDTSASVLKSEVIMNVSYCLTNSKHPRAPEMMVNLGMKAFQEE